MLIWDRMPFHPVYVLQPLHRSIQRLLASQKQMGLNLL
jgi:hypothetical protein